MPDAPVVRRPLLPAATLFTIGVMLGPAQEPAADLLLALASALLTFALARRRRVLGALLLPIPFFFTGILASSWTLPPKEDLSAIEGALATRGDGVLVEGVIAEAPEIRPGGAWLILDLVGASTVAGAPLRPVEGRARVRVPRGAGETPCGSPGDRVRFFGRLDRPEDVLMPAPSSVRAAAARRGTTLFGSVSSAKDCLRVRPKDRSGIGVLAERARAAVHAAIDRAVPGERGAVIRAFATGDRSGIGRDVDEAFQASGLSHLLAVSGLNLAIICGMFTLGLGFVFRRIERIALGIGADRLAAIVALPFVGFYTLLVGASPSAVRAAIMVVALLGARMSRRDREPWTALSIAVIAMLAFDPSALGDVSFQLSFAAVAALFRLYPVLRDRLAPRLREKPAWVRWPVEIALASAAATIGTAPLVARHFQRISLIGFVANVPAGPLSSLFLVPLSLLGGLAAAAHDAIGAPLLAIADVAAGALLWIARVSASVPHGAVRLPTPTITECLLAYCAILALSLAPRSRVAKKVGLVALGALVALSASLEIARTLRSTMEVSFLPVGQGDAIVAELPGGTVMVVDTGPPGTERDAADRVISPYLRSRRIRRIDVLALTHPHADHAGGVASLARGFEIGEVWWNGDRRGVEPALLDPILRLRPRVLTASTAPIQLGETRVEIAGPVGGPDRHPTVNDGSLVLRLVLGERAILLAGDAERAAEETMLRRHESGAQSLAADVLKVGHHGSDTSSSEAFLDAVSPRTAVIEVGLRNRFGLPDPEVLVRLERRGIRVLRTDLNGLVIVETDGRTLDARPFRP